jgi:cytochrome bd-type quinol oxidase subunit 2
MGHLGLLVIFSVLVGAFFALLSKDTPRESWKVFWVMTASMIVASLLLAFVMFPFPLR